jgi:hypothetical protein
VPAGEFLLLVGGRAFGLIDREHREGCDHDHAYRD